MAESTIKCLIVDDEKLARDLIEAHLQQLTDFELVASCASAIEASLYLTDHDIDLLFLDIEMPVLKGTDFYHSLSHKPSVIFTTAYREYAIDGFELEAVDYLLKPITFARFFKAIERFKNSRKVHTSVTQQTESTPEYIFIRSNRKSIKINYHDIRYIQGLKDYLQIHTNSGTCITKTTLKALLSSLPSQFIQVHRSYIVNRDHITAYTNHDIELGETEVPIGETHQSRIKQWLQDLA
ncbi:LytR/AlgR family response regulator transcription factor [Marinicella sediminis]|uniref:LytR/AlgR family response regulator transcription factor n=1 Tax=Marinicella sediminis TaxID=1792834 RepID=A0ABV7J9M8_9GAMM|nr:LytTR family DNA-binding domain-containing protein [Marinicella sediminis]